MQESPFANLFDSLMRAAFPDSTPAEVSAVLDAQLASEYLNDSKIGFSVFEGPQGRKKGLLFDDTFEQDAWASRVIAAYPVSESYVRERSGRGMLVLDLSGPSPQLMFFAEAADQVGDTLDLGTGSIRGLAAFDEALELPQSVATQVQAVREKASGGEWIVQSDDAGVVGVYWTTGSPYSEDEAAVVDSHAVGAALGPYGDLVRQAGFHPNPMTLGFHGDRGMSAVMWGCVAPDFRPGDFSEYFPADVTPTEEQFTAAFVSNLSPADAEPVGALLEASILPNYLECTTAESPRAALEALWEWLGQAFDEPGRLVSSFRLIAQASEASLLSGAALEYAVARYLLDHEERDPSTLGVEISKEVSELDLEGLVSRANSLMTEILASHAEVESMGTLALLPGIDTDWASIVDTCRRAISGEFYGAEGALNAVLEEGGPKTFDDDPAAPQEEYTEEGDEQHREAAIEEALAMDDDEDFA